MSKQEMRTKLNDLSDQAIAALDANQWELYLTIAAELDLLEDQYLTSLRKAVR